MTGRTLLFFSPRVREARRRQDEEEDADLQAGENEDDETLSCQIGKLSTVIALKAVRVGTDEMNFRILKMLPTNVEKIMMETGLTKVPVNIRMNELEKVCLAKRYKGTGKIVLTDFGKFFVDKIEEYEEIVGEYVIDIVKRCIG